MYGAMAVKTYENGKLIDDAINAFLDRQEIEDILSPIVVDLLDGPARVAASAIHATDILAANQDDLRLQIAPRIIHPPKQFKHLRLKLPPPLLPVLNALGVEGELLLVSLV
jgi:hypothetical protein